MAADAGMNSIADRLTHEFVNAAGEPASHDHVADVVEAAARPLVDAPLQLYVALLVEKEARDKLRGEGMHTARP